MTWEICASEAIIRKAGANANSVIVASNQALADWYDQAVGEVIVTSRRDWVNEFSSVASGAKWSLAKAVSAIAAVNVIDYDMSGYTNVTEETAMMDVLRDEANKNIKELKDFKSNTIKGV